MSKGFKYQGERPDDIFEAITVMAKRARQINEKRAIKYSLKPQQIDGEEELMTDEQYDAEEFDNLEKPTTIAMREYERENLKWEYYKENPHNDEHSDGFEDHFV
ncbi:MAG TPA: hypothetical protein ENN84_06360 [Candidatus Marinimicrobia bacterium]|nr:hypothetical protein [Candidatus Neomarinimicrobiota bacterium]